MPSSARASTSLLSRSTPGSLLRAERILSPWDSTSISSGVPGSAQMCVRSAWINPAASVPKRDRVARAIDSALESSRAAAAGPRWGKSASHAPPRPVRRPGLMNNSSKRRLAEGRGQGPTVLAPTVTENGPSRLARTATPHGQSASPPGAGTAALSHRAAARGRKEARRIAGLSHGLSPRARAALQL